MELFLLILFALSAGFWFTTEEFPALAGLYIPTYSVKSRNIIIITTLAIALALILLPESFPSSVIFDGIRAGDARKSFAATALLSTVTVLAIMKAAGLRGSFLLTFAAALLLCDSGTAMSGHLALRFLLSIAASALASFVISAAFSLLFKYTIAGKRVHLIRLAARLRGVVILLIVLSAAALALNWGGFFRQTGSLISSLPYRSSVWLLCAAFVLLCAICGKRTNRIVCSRSSKYYDFFLYNVLAAGSATIVVLCFFSFGSLCSALGLCAMPLSLSAVLYAALAGSEAIIGQRLMETDEYVREAAATVISPVSAILLCHVLQSLTGSGRDESSVELFITGLSLTVIILTGVVMYFKKQKEQKKATEQLVRSQQQQIYEHSMALNDMEMKVILSENQALHENLEIKRQEVMNVALSICEQREFLESIYSIVKELEATDNPARKAELTSELGASIRQRLSYDRDVDTSYFYARAESLHEDFNQKLSEAFPDLTPQERRLTTLLRLGFSTKYISTLMGIAPKSVEIARYRLRQKLGLKKGDNLVNFINSI